MYIKYNIFCVAESSKAGETSCPAGNLSQCTVIRCLDPVIAASRSSSFCL